MQHVPILLDRITALVIMVTRMVNTSKEMVPTVLRFVHQINVLMYRKYVQELVMPGNVYVLLDLPLVLQENTVTVSGISLLFN